MDPLRDIGRRIVAILSKVAAQEPLGARVKLSVLLLVVAMTACEGGTGRPSPTVPSPSVDPLADACGTYNDVRTYLKHDMRTTTATADQVAAQLSNYEHRLERDAMALLRGDKPTMGHVVLAIANLVDNLRDAVDSSGGEVPGTNATLKNLDVAADALAASC